MNIIPRKYGKGGGRGGRMSVRQLELCFDASLFVCFSFFVPFFSVCLPVRFVCLFVVVVVVVVFLSI